MSILNKLKSLKDQKSYSIPAKRVMEHLKPILSKSSDLQNRWIWELLQNASDLGDNIKARIEITKDKLIFSHNGKPFSLDEAYNLIMPDSTKDDETSRKKSIIGQFGTGFISTHILSRKIQVSGIIEDEDQLYGFNFHLDRSERDDKEFLIESIKKSELEYQKSLIKLQQLPKNEYQTSFIYFTSDTYVNLKGEEIVNSGLEKFNDLIPFVFAFRRQLMEIEIIDQRGKEKKWGYKREEIESNRDSLLIIQTLYFKNGRLTNKKLVGNIIKNETEIAFPIEKIEKNRFRLLTYPEDCPKLYCAFPMIGSGQFNFPAAIHSEKFLPNRERDSIEITSHDKENRTRLLEAVEAFKSLLQIFDEEEWSDAYNIIRIEFPEFNDTDTENWFQEAIFEPIIDSLYDARLIELDQTLDLDDYRTSLRNSYIPYADRRTSDKDDVVSKTYDLAFQVIPHQIPNRNHYLKWFQILDFDVFESEKLDLEKLCELVSSKTDLKEFAEANHLTESKAVAYFVKLVEFVIEQKKEELLNKYPLLLNQNNTFTTIKSLKYDGINHKGLKKGYGEKLKDIFQLLAKKDCRDSLLHRKFESIKNLPGKDETYEFKELAKNIDEELRNYDGSIQDREYKLILKELFNWHSSSGLSDENLANLFPFFNSNKSQLYLSTKSPEELDHAFEIEMSGKSRVLAKLAKSKLSIEKLEMFSKNFEMLSSFFEWLNSKQMDNPDDKLGNIGEKYVEQQLCKVFGEKRVVKENKAEYDFRVLEDDLKTTMFYIDAKTTANGIANSENVPFFMRLAQWNFLDNEQVSDRYLIARVFIKNDQVDIKYLKLGNINFTEVK